MTLMLIVTSLLQAAMPDSAAWKERHFPDLPIVPACTFARPAKEVRSPHDLPEQVRMEVVRFFESGGGLADADGMFNSTDVIDAENVPHRRFLRAYLIDNVWLIWWEMGGHAHGVNTLALIRRHQAGGGPPLYSAVPGSIFTGNVCAGSEAFLAGARAAPGF